MLGLRPPEMIFLAVLVLFFFGAKKLPEMGKGLGEGIKNFKKSMKAGSEDETSSNKEKKD